MAVQVVHVTVEIALTKVVVHVVHPIGQATHTLLSTVYPELQAVQVTLVVPNRRAQLVQRVKLVGHTLQVFDMR